MLLFANFMMLIWPVVVLVLFARARLPIALSVAIIVGYLILPEKIGLDLPGLPPLSKHNVPALTAFLILLLGAEAFRTEEQRPSWWPKHWVFGTLLVVFLLSSFGTVLTNQSNLVFGRKVLPGLGLSDLRIETISGIFAILPLLLGRKFLATPKAQRALLYVIMISALCYTLLVLYEVRMSPMLSRKIYGFFPHSWLQHRRDGGWRPIVFLAHGLSVGLFLSMATVVAFGLVKAAREKITYKYFLFGGWLFLVVLLSKNLGAFLLVCIFAPTVFFLTPRLRVILAACVVGAILFYPMFRSTGVLSTESLSSAVEPFNASRAASFRFRLKQEDQLLARAHQKPLFGWGGWSRARVYDPETGRDLSTTDGLWLITFGERGWFGYLSTFGLLTMPIILLAFHSKAPIPRPTALIAIVLALNLIDLLPNAGLTMITWLLAGSLIGALELLREGGGADPPDGSTPDAAEPQLPQRRNAYSRFPPKDIQRIRMS